MGEIEWKHITPNELIQDIETQIKTHNENKYAFQVGLKDLDFDINNDVLKVLGIDMPFKSIDQAEQALQFGAITPMEFVEDDSTTHHVLVFDHRPVGYSGFMNCVTHSLALTDHGVFEVGRYPAISLASQSRYWQWFLHRRLATTDDVANLIEGSQLSPEQFTDRVYHALVDS
ncbi:MAG: hypothetical protein MUP03_02200 [Anaerolineales bacterium]|nr:hypothetical protein [Anaerolineales bacterium]